jgi:DUF1365 family protein
MESAIYQGTLRHRRFSPRAHEFSYPVFMAFFDIERIPELMQVSPFTSYNRWNWASFYERDHFGDPALPLRRRLESHAAAQGIRLPDGRIFLLTNLRYLGYVFNPVSFFYCLDGGGKPRTILAEVNSTFGERHNYWLSEAVRPDPRRANHYRCRKLMHVSPFMPMGMEYAFSFSTPGERLGVQIATMQGKVKVLDATLALRREPWSSGAVGRALLRHPWMTGKVIGAIHWEALRLYLKRVPVFPRPEPRDGSQLTGESAIGT